MTKYCFRYIIEHLFLIMNIDHHFLFISKISYNLKYFSIYIKCHKSNLIQLMLFQQDYIIMHQALLQTNRLHLQ